MIKKINIWRHTVFLFGLAVGVTSCDPYSGCEYWIDNKSDSSLFVVYQLKQSPTLMKVRVDKQSSKLLESYETSGRLNEIKNGFLTDFYDSLGMYIDTTNVMEIEKEYWREDVWNYSQENVGHFGVIRVGDNVYRLEVTNEDL